MSKVILELRNSLKFYVSGNEITRALKETNVTFAAGEFVAITGESGSGKSTLLHILAGILPCDRGAVWLDGTTTEQYGDTEWEEYRREVISFVSQDYGILSGNTVLENVMSALYIAGMRKKEALARAKELLQKVELWTYRHRRAARLSSGQKQRLSIARAVAKPAPVLLADEPTGNLDKENTENILRLFREEAKKRLVIMVTHNYESAEDYVTRHILVEDGIIAADEQLCMAEELRENKTEKKNGKRGFLSEILACYQLKARPVWSALMSLFFMLTAFMVFVLLGTFISRLDDVDTRAFNSKTFTNEDERRLLARKTNAGLFSGADYKAILSVTGVEAIEKYGMFSDTPCYFRENVDYSFKVTEYIDEATHEKKFKKERILGETDVFGHSVPVFAKNENFLSAGRYPQGFGEAVAAGDEELIGTMVTAYYAEPAGQGKRSVASRVFEIVGVTEYGDGLYFSDACAEDIYRVMERGNYKVGEVTGHSDEIAITLKAYAYADRVMSKLSSMGYEVISPYQMCSIVQNEELAAERLHTLVVCSVSFLVLVLVELLLMGVLFDTQMISYLRLKHIGLAYKTALASVFWQVMLLTLCGQLIAICVIRWTGIGEIRQLVQILDYLELRHYGILSLIHFAVSCLSVLVTGVLLKRRIFPFAQRNIDIDLSELDAGKE